MTQEERDQLLLAMDKKLEVFIASCQFCRAEVAEHKLILEGRAGNSGSPGLKAEVIALKRSQGRHLLWFQTQLGLVIAGLLAMLKSLIGK